MNILPMQPTSLAILSTVRMLFQGSVQLRADQEELRQGIVFAYIVLVY